MGFYGFCMVRKALGLMEIGPREVTQGELQGELHVDKSWKLYKNVISSKIQKADN